MSRAVRLKHKLDLEKCISKNATTSILLQVTNKLKLEAKIQTLYYNSMLTITQERFEREHIQRKLFIFHLLICMYILIVRQDTK